MIRNPEIHVRMASAALCPLTMSDGNQGCPLSADFRFGSTGDSAAGAQQTAAFGRQADAHIALKSAARMAEYGQKRTLTGADLRS